MQRRRTLLWWVVGMMLVLWGMRIAHGHRVESEFPGGIFCSVKIDSPENGAVFYAPDGITSVFFAADHFGAIGPLPEPLDHPINYHISSTGNDGPHNGPPEEIYWESDLITFSPGEENCIKTGGYHSMLSRVKTTGGYIFRAITSVWRCDPKEARCEEVDMVVDAHLYSVFPQ